jgi:hypothetical protein
MNKMVIQTNTPIYAKVSNGVRVMVGVRVRIRVRVRIWNIFIAININPNPNPNPNPNLILLSTPSARRSIVYQDMLLTLT